jgi:hypothetical protein
MMRVETRVGQYLRGNGFRVQKTTPEMWSANVFDQNVMTSSISSRFWSLKFRWFSVRSLKISVTNVGDYCSCTCWSHKVQILDSRLWRITVAFCSKLGKMCSFNVNKMGFPILKCRELQESPLMELRRQSVLTQESPVHMQHATMFHCHKRPAFSK